MKTTNGYGLYAHMHEPSQTRMGDRVWPGDIIGNVGNTGIGCLPLKNPMDHLPRHHVCNGALASAVPPFGGQWPRVGQLPMRDIGEFNWLPAGAIDTNHADPYGRKGETGTP